MKDPGTSPPHYLVYVVCSNPANQGKLIVKLAIMLVTDTALTRLLRLSKLATNTVCVHVDGRAPLEDWVDGFMVVMGAAVHPMPVRNLHSTSDTLLICHLARVHSRMCTNSGRRRCPSKTIFASSLQRPDQKFPVGLPRSAATALCSCPSQRGRNYPLHDC